MFLLSCPSSWHLVIRCTRQRHGARSVLWLRKQEMPVMDHSGTEYAKGCGQCLVEWGPRKANSSRYPFWIYWMKPLLAAAAVAEVRQVLVQLQCPTVFSGPAELLTSRTGILIQTLRRAQESNRQRVLFGSFIRFTLLCYT
jgi:hypothetical protein